MQPGYGVECEKVACFDFHCSKCFDLKDEKPHLAKEITEEQCDTSMDFEDPSIASPSESSSEPDNEWDSDYVPSQLLSPFLTP